MGETAGILIVLGIGAAVVGLAVQRSTISGWKAVVGTVLVTAVAIVTSARDPQTDAAVNEPARDRPIQVLADEYVSSRACRKCHPNEHSSWHDSYHRTMTQVANPATVIGDFRTDSLVRDGVRFDLGADDNKLWVSISDATLSQFSPDNVPVRRELVLTTGSHHMQVYWMPLSDDARILGMLPFTYHRETKRWMSRDSAFLSNVNNEEMIEYGRWNDSCLHCHATASTTGAPTGDERDWRKFETRASEFGISCEACHGPGSRHVAAHQNPVHRYRQHLGSTGDDTIVNPSRLSHERSSQVCGQCHSVFGPKTHEGWLAARRDGYNAFRPGDDLDAGPLRVVFDCCRPVEEYEHPMLREALADADFVRDRFWPDGMSRVTGREYNGLIDSPCFQQGEMSCLSCHKMHQASDDTRERSEWANDQLHPLMTTNAACTQCHKELADDVSLAAHTHHDIGSSGSQCYNCHMSYTTYGLLKANRSHQIDSPDVATNIATGRPNACNQCHLDETLEWTASHLHDWYDIAAPELSEDQKSIAASVLWILKGDAGQRALMAWSLGWKDAQQISRTDWMQPYLAELMADPYDAVRFVAWRSFESIVGQSQIDVLANDYDPIANRRKQQSAWESEFDGGYRPRLLIRENELDRATYNRLLNSRDQTPINLLE